MNSMMQKPQVLDRSRRGGGECQQKVRRWSEEGQQDFRRWSGEGQKVMGWSAEGQQEVMRWSGEGQQEVRRSGEGQQEVRTSAGGQQKVSGRSLLQSDLKAVFHLKEPSTFNDRKWRVKLVLTRTEQMLFLTSTIGRA